MVLFISGVEQNFGKKNVVFVGDFHTTVVFFHGFFNIANAVAVFYDSFLFFIIA